jgi:hypothetical protein
MPEVMWYHECACAWCTENRRRFLEEEPIAVGDYPLSEHGLTAITTEDRLERIQETARWTPDIEEAVVQYVSDWAMANENGVELSISFSEIVDTYNEMVDNMAPPKPHLTPPKEDNWIRIMAQSWLDRESDQFEEGWRVYRKRDGGNQYYTIVHDALMVGVIDQSGVWLIYDNEDESLDNVLREVYEYIRDRYGITIYCFYVPSHNKENCEGLCYHIKTLTKCNTWNMKSKMVDEFLVEEEEE